MAEADGHGSGDDMSVSSADSDVVFVVSESRPAEQQQQHQHRDAGEAPGGTVVAGGDNNVNTSSSSRRMTKSQRKNRRRKKSRQEKRRRLEQQLAATGGEASVASEEAAAAACIAGGDAAAGAAAAGAATASSHAAMLAARQRQQNAAAAAAAQAQQQQQQQQQAAGAQLHHHRANVGMPQQIPQQMPQPPPPPPRQEPMMQRGGGHPPAPPPPPPRPPPPPPAEMVPPPPPPPATAGHVLTHGYADYDHYSTTAHSISASAYDQAPHYQQQQQQSQQSQQSQPQQQYVDSAAAQLMHAASAAGYAPQHQQPHRHHHHHLHQQQQQVQQYYPSHSYAQQQHMYDQNQYHQHAQPPRAYQLQSHHHQRQSQSQSSLHEGQEHRAATSPAAHTMQSLSEFPPPAYAPMESSDSTPAPAPSPAGSGAPGRDRRTSTSRWADRQQQQQQQQQQRELGQKRSAKRLTSQIRNAISTPNAVYHQHPRRSLLPGTMRERPPSAAASQPIVDTRWRAKKQGGDGGQSQSPPQGDGKGSKTVASVGKKSEKSSSPARADGSPTTNPSPLTQQQRGQLAAAESDILLHETTLKSLNGELTEVNRQIAAERANILRRKTNIERLERRSANLKTSREESAALVRRGEQTLKKTMNRLKRRLGDIGGDGADNGSGCGTAGGDAAATVELPASDEGQVVADEATALLEKVDGELMDDQDSGLDPPASAKSISSDLLPPGEEDARRSSTMISASIAPFHQNRELMERMWSMGRIDPSASLHRVSRDNAIGGETPDKNGNEEPVSNFGGQSTNASLPHLLAPISTQDLLRAVFAILEAEPSAAKSEAVDERCGSQLAAFLQSFLRGTCLDPLAVAGYDDIASTNDGAEGNRDQSSETQQQPGERVIDPTIALCPYELGGQCADSSCPYQHLDGKGQRDDAGLSPLRTGLQDLQSLRLPLPPSVDTKEFTKDDLKRLSAEQLKRSRLEIDTVMDEIEDGQAEMACAADSPNTKVRSHPGPGPMETNWDGQTELDFVSLPRGVIAVVASDDDEGLSAVAVNRGKRNAITDEGALSSSEDEGSDMDEGGTGVFHTVRGNDAPSSGRCLFWHSQPENIFCFGGAAANRHKDIVVSINNDGRGSVGVDDLLLEMGFAVETNADRQSRFSVKYCLPNPSDVGGSIRATAAAVDAIQLCVHSGRYDIAYALLDIAKEVASSSDNDKCLASALNHAKEVVDEAALCCTQTLGSNMFNVQVSLTILSQCLRSYCNGRDTSGSSAVDWEKLELDCYYVQDDASSSLTDSFSHLSRMTGSSPPARKEIDDVSTQEALWVQKLRSSLKNALALIDSVPTSSPDSSTRQLIGYATIGNELASLLSDSAFTANNSAMSIHSVVHLILDPAWDIIRRFVAKHSKAKVAEGQGGSLCLLNPSVIGCCLVGPMMFASASTFLSHFFAERGPSAVKSDGRPSPELVLDPKSKGTLTAISNFLNKCARSLRRINDDALCGGDIDVGSSIFGDTVIAPLYSLCLSVATTLSSFGQTKMLLGEAFAISIDANGNERKRSPNRTCLVLSELIWSQFIYSVAISRLVAKESSNIDRTFSGSDLAVKLQQYGINLRHVTLSGDSALVRRAVNGDTQALSLCKQIVTAAFISGGSPCWVGDDAFDDIDSVKLEADSSSTSEVVLDEFPSSLLLMGNLCQLSLTGYHIKSLPPSFGYFYAHLENLNLSNNQLSVLPESIGNLGALVELDVSSNDLEELPQGIGKLSKLTKVDASYNRLTLFPHALFGCNNLAVLNLEENDIGSVPSEIALKLTNLQHLLLDGNPIGMPKKRLSQTTR